MGKFGRVKRQHGRVQGLDAVLNTIIQQCPHVSRIIPGRMGRKKGKTKPRLKVQYATGAQGHHTDDAPTGANGIKCIYTCAGSWQEVFLVCSDVEAAHRWLLELPIIKGA